MNRFKVLVFFLLKLLLLFIFINRDTIFLYFVFFIHYLERDKKIVRMLRNIGLLEC